MVTDCDENGLATVSLRNKFCKGDTLELVGPDFRPVEMTAEQMWDEDGALLDEPKKPQMVFKMQLPCKVPALSVLRHSVELSAKD